jgi:hypothetical protein
MFQKLYDVLVMSMGLIVALMSMICERTMMPDKQKDDVKASC